LAQIFIDFATLSLSLLEFAARLAGTEGIEHWQPGRAPETRSGGSALTWLAGSGIDQYTGFKAGEKE